MIPISQAELSQATSKARQWFERNRKRFRYHLPERTDRTYEQVYDGALSEVDTLLHLHVLSEAFQARAIPERQDRPAHPTLTPEHPPAPTNRTSRSHLAIG